MKRNDLLPLRIGMTMLCVLTAAVIFRNSIQDAELSSIESGSLLESLGALLRAVHIDIAITDHLIRKTAHFVEYFILGAVLSGTAYAYALTLRGMFAGALPVGLAVAVCDELIQTTAPGRSCEITDMALDFSAVVTAAAIMSIILAIYRRHKVKEGK
jgi:VanZ family protein